MAKLFVFAIGGTGEPRPIFTGASTVATRQLQITTEATA